MSAGLEEATVLATWSTEHVSGGKRGVLGEEVWERGHMSSLFVSQRADGQPAACTKAWMQAAHGHSNRINSFVLRLLQTMMRKSFTKQHNCCAKFLSCVTQPMTNEALDQQWQISSPQWPYRSYRSNDTNCATSVLYATGIDGMTYQIKQQRLKSFWGGKVK